jgi:hypothetical protein
MLAGIPRIGAFLGNKNKRRDCARKNLGCNKRRHRLARQLFARLDVSFEDQSTIKFLETNKIQEQVVEVNCDVSKLLKRHPLRRKVPFFFFCDLKKRTMIIQMD